jgi:hypothetical protein
MFSVTIILSNVKLNVVVVNIMAPSTIIYFTEIATVKNITEAQ